MREVFTRFSKGRSVINVRDIERVAHKGLGIYLDKFELATIKAAVGKASSAGEIDFKLFQMLLTPLMDDDE